VWTFAIITSDANELVADIHDRMPVVLAPDDYARAGSARSRTRAT
jgi:putative SOS response-associated peptidase YedK